MSYNAVTGAFETTCCNPTCRAKVTIPSVELENLRTGERLPRKLCAKCEAEKLIIRGDEMLPDRAGLTTPSMPIVGIPVSWSRDEQWYRAARVLRGPENPDGLRVDGGPE